MNTKITLLISAAFLIGATSSLSAGRGNTALKVLGGIVAGVAIAEALDDDHHRHRTKRGHANYHQPHSGNVHVDIGVSVGHRGHHGNACARGCPPPRYQTIKVWVPGYWKRVHTSCGYEKRWVSGYYKYERRRVGDCNHGYSNSSPHHGYSHGYDYQNHGGRRGHRG